jgi:uncharacterized membrane protein
MTSHLTVKLHITKWAGAGLTTVKSDATDPKDDDVNGVPDWRQASPGKPLHITYNVSNTGNALDWYNISVALDNPEWSSSLSIADNLTWVLQPKRLNTTNPNHYQHFNVTLWVPQRTLVGETCLVTVSARSQVNTSVIVNHSVTAVCGEGYGVDLEPEENISIIAPGTLKTFTVSVTNTGNVQDTIGIAWALPSAPGWDVTVNITSVTLDPYNTTKFTVSASPDFNVTADKVLRINITGTSLGDPSEYDRVNISVAAGEVLDVAFTPLFTGELTGKPDGYVEFDLIASNEGNVNASLALSGETLYEDWSVRMNLTHFGLLPGERRYIGVNISVPGLIDNPDTEWLAINGLMVDTINNFTLNATAEGGGEAGSYSAPIRVLPFRRSTVYFTEAATDERLIPCVAGGTLVRDALWNGSGRRSDVPLSELEEEGSGSTIPGRDLVYEVVVVNTGNGPDVVNLDVEGSTRHMLWADLPMSTFSLEVGEQGETTMTVNPDVDSRPYWHEEARISVLPRSVHGDVGVPGVTTTRVESMAVVEDRVQVQLGATLGFNVTLMNVPLQGDNSSAGMALVDSYNILVSLARGSGGASGWLFLTPHNFTVTLKEAYESSDVEVRLRSTLSDDPQQLEALVDITGTSQVIPTKSDSARQEILAYFTDFWVSDEEIGLVHPKEGETVDVKVRVHAASNVVNIHAWARVFVDGEQVMQELLLLNTTAANYLLEFSYEAGDLHWAQKQSEVPLMVELDREGRVNESKPGEGVEAGEANNRVEVMVLVTDATRMR